LDRLELERLAGRLVQILAIAAVQRAESGLETGTGVVFLGSRCAPSAARER
jgi:hypothetical protein